MTPYRLLCPGVQDAESLAALGAATFLHAWAPLYTAPDAEAALHAYVQEAFAPRTLRAHLADPALKHWAVRAGDAWVAYAKAGPLGLPVDAPEHGTAVELHRLYVAHDHQRCGLGTQLLAAFEQWAQQGAHAAAYMGVWYGNTAALALYRAHGYAEVGGFYYAAMGDYQRREIDRELILKKELI